MSNLFYGRSSDAISVGAQITMPEFIDIIQHRQMPFVIRNRSAINYSMTFAEVNTLFGYGGRIDYAARALRVLPEGAAPAALVQDATDKGKFTLTAHASQRGCAEFEFYDRDYRREIIKAVVEPRIQDLEGNDATHIQLKASEDHPDHTKYLTFFGGIDIADVTWFGEHPDELVSMTPGSNLYFMGFPPFLPPFWNLAGFGPIIAISGLVAGTMTLGVTGLYGTTDTVTIEVV